MKMLRYLLAILSIGTAFAQVQPSTDNTPQTLGNKTLISPVIKGAVLSGATIYADQMAGADMSIKIANCLSALYANSPDSGTCIANFSGNQTWSVNPFTYASNIPATGTLEICGVGQMALSVPIVRPDNWNMEGCGMAQGSGDLSNHFIAGGSFPATYTTGTITKGTAGYLGTITFSGATLTQNMVGCRFVAPATQPTGANNTFGIIHAISGSTATLGWEANNGSGAGAASTYAIYCAMMVAGDGAKSGAPDDFTGDTSHFVLDCNNVAGCGGYVDWYSQEGTTATDLVISNCIDICFDLETVYAQQAGPFINISAEAGGSPCTPGAIAVVIRVGNTATKGLHNSTLGGYGGCSNEVVDIQSSYQVMSGISIGGGTVGIGLGYNTSCPTACPYAPTAVANDTLVNINGQPSGTSVVGISNAFGAPGAINLFDISVSSGWTYAVTDLYNGCNAAYNVGSYLLNGYTGTIQDSGAGTATCFATPELAGVSLMGSSSGVVSILPGAAAAGTYNFNLPTTAGTTGYALVSGGGGSSPMMWGALTGSGTVNSGTTGQFAFYNSSGTAVSGSSVLTTSGGNVTSSGQLTGTWINGNAGLDISGNFNMVSPSGNVMQYVYFDSGTPATATVRGQGGSGSNIAGGNVVAESGYGTGNATGSTYTISTPHAGSTGSAPQSFNQQIVAGDNTVGMPNLASSSSATTGTMCWTTSTGNLTVDTTLACLSSTGKVKKNVRPLDVGLPEVMALRPISYDLKDEYNPEHLGPMVGLIAEDVQKVDPRLVGVDANGDPRGVRYMQMTAILVRAIQDQQHEINQLKRQLKRAH